MDRHIPDTWRYSGPWYGNDRTIVDHADIVSKHPVCQDGLFCHQCGNSNAVTLSSTQTEYPFHNYCPKCGLVWHWFVARCPDCETGSMWNKDCKTGEVRCSICDMVFSESFVREVNEDPDFIYY